jgi:hypothetical protein
MVTTVNEPWLLNIPLSERISTTLTTLEVNRATEPESIFTLSSSMSFSFFFGIIAALLEGYIQNVPLTYSINELSVYINQFIHLMFLQLSQLSTSILYETHSPTFSSISESGKISLKVFKMVYSLAKPSIPCSFERASIIASLTLVSRSKVVIGCRLITCRISTGSAAQKLLS